MQKGHEGFDAYYGELFGDRWNALSTALTSPRRHAAYTRGLTKAYYLDPASIVAAHLLPLDGAQRVLDMCAAPGGKALIIAGRLPDGATLVANERSRRRRARLAAVLDEHLDSPIRSNIRITAHDAGRWGLHEPDTYDAILADVPCSSERHVLVSPEDLERWSVHRIKRLALTQFAILAAAIDSVRPGGYVLYATCALTPRENDDVVGKALRRRQNVEIVPLPPDAAIYEHDEPFVATLLSAAEDTEYGIHMLPDVGHGAGPIYCALLRKAIQP